MEKNDFLSKKYPDLPGSKPVERAVQKKIQEGEKGSQTKEGLVEAYLDRLEEFFKTPEKFNRLKYKILEKYVTKYEEIPESYWKLQERIIRKRGEGGDWAEATEEQKEELKKQNAERVLSDQRASLEQWIDYFASPDSEYISKNLKYWILRNVIGLQEYDKEKKEFSRRSKGTIKQFPDINYEALAYVVDVIVKKLEDKKIEFEHDIQSDEREAFQKFLAKEDFTKLYAWANDLMNPIPDHLLPVTEGRWMKYEQDSDSHEIVKTIRGKGTGWCTAGENTAKTQLQGGDFYIYYSLDDNGEPTLPRLAIRMEENKVAEVRGVAYKQNIDPYIVPVLETKLKNFGQEGEAYKKKSADMNLLTEIEAKTKQNQKLTRDELVFLYEIDSKIEGFGYQRDPRIKELRDQRKANIKEDAAIFFECSPEEVAWKQEYITEKTKAYVGELFQGIFQKGIEHIYTSFPEGRIEKADIEIGGLTEEELEIKIENKKDEQGRNYISSSYAERMMKSPDFAASIKERLKNLESINLVRLKVRDLGFTKNPTTDELYERAEEFGLELCPAETGPHLRLKYEEVFGRVQPMNEHLLIAMRQITVLEGSLHAFMVRRPSDGMWLDIAWAEPTRDWDPDDEFVFRLRKLEP